jgi:cobalt-zinc-cadmium resistance protein CzcA
MISRLIRESFHAPLLTALLVAAGTVIGAFWLQDLPRDVFPDLSAPVFNVITQNAAMGAEELETAIAIPLEVALAGLPDVRRVRSNSQLGVAQVTIEFDPNADYYRSRQFVAERVAQVAGQLPVGTDPPLISSLTGRLNEIFEFTLEAEPGTADLMALRDLAEFEVNNRLVAVPGVAAVERLGGYLRQFQVQLDPERMSARRISLDDVMHAVEESNLNAAGGIVAQGSIEWTVRALGRAHTIDDLRRTVVTVRGDVPVLLGDIADIRELPPCDEGRAPPEKARSSTRGSSSSSAPTRCRSRPGFVRPSRTFDARCQGRRAAHVRPVATRELRVGRRGPSSHARWRLCGARDPTAARQHARGVGGHVDHPLSIALAALLRPLRSA